MIGRCETCKHWDADSVIPHPFRLDGLSRELWGQCWELRGDEPHDDNKVYAEHFAVRVHDGTDVLGITHYDSKPGPALTMRRFGCVLHEPRT